MTTSKILLVGIAPIDRQALVSVLIPDQTMVTGVDSTSAALDAIDQDPPHLIITAVHWPDASYTYPGFELCRRLRSHPKTSLIPILFFDPAADVETRIKSHAVGADNFFRYPIASLESLKLIEVYAKRGQNLERMIKNFRSEVHRPVKLVQQAIQAVASLDDLPLTPAEKRVFQGVAQGLSNRLIADQFAISPRTVQTHITSILRKLKLNNRAQIVRFAFEGGYVSGATERDPRVAPLLS
ncbi:MAG: LuxR C-terminal-related transcriptional regulator [Prochlorothrix sp.]